VAEALKPHFDEVRFLDYRHWRTDAPDIDVEYELEQAVQLVDGLGEYVVVAKSIGTAITAIAVRRERLGPRKCVFLGFPLKVVKADLPEVAAGLKTLPQAVFVQNEQDPLGSSADMKDYLRTYIPRGYMLKPLPGDTHDYLDFDLIAELASQY
jgi:hypothetical protein